MMIFKPNGLIGYSGVIYHLVPKYQKHYAENFDHGNTLKRRINLVIHLTQIHELGVRNHMVKPPGISVQST